MKKKNLLKLIEELQGQVALLEVKVNLLQPTIQHHITIPSVFGTNCQHEYPNNWVGTGSPPCNKCGKTANYFSGTASIGNGLPDNLTMVLTGSTSKAVPGTLTSNN